VVFAGHFAIDVETAQHLPHEPAMPAVAIEACEEIRPPDPGFRKQTGEFLVRETRQIPVQAAQHPLVAQIRSEVSQASLHI
jgi:hypothetical protein